MLVKNKKIKNNIVFRMVVKEVVLYLMELNVDNTIRAHLAINF